MDKEYTMTFYEYLCELAEDPEDPAGDFATDALTDSFFPQEVRANTEGFAKIVNYLYYDLSVSEYVMDAFMSAWRSYYCHVTGSDWTYV